MTVAALVLAPRAAADRAQAPKPSFSTDPEAALLTPAFGWNRRDYAVRCDGDILAVRVHGVAGWSSQLGSGRWRSGSYEVSRRLAYGEAFTVSFLHRRTAKSRRFHVRCLPPDFPAYHFRRIRPGGAKLFGVQIDPYATFFSSDGAPIWWFDSGGRANDVQVLPDRTISWDPQDPLADVPSRFEIRNLDGKVVRTLQADGGRTDLHELLMLRNGNYLFGGHVTYSHVDASAYGGSSDADVGEAELQEVTPAGKVVWTWNSRDHIDLSETPQRWWNAIIPLGQPYDVVHWNSAQVNGKYLLISFRHLDAVYEINRRTGRIVWKLGGTPTSKSLTVVGDPEGSYPLGGQHDPRLLPDGTISIHDNGTSLGRAPRVVRYRVNTETMTAHYVSELTDPRITSSMCCGSARLTTDDSWLVGWGGNQVTTSYDAQGRRNYTLRLGQGFSYRSTPVTPGLVTPAQFRAGMDAMAP